MLLGNVVRLQTNKEQESLLLLNRRMPNGMYGGVRGERKSPLLDRA